MHARFLHIFGCFIGLLALAACAQEQPRGPVILAAASLQDALEAVADEWEGRGHARPVLAFAGSGSLARQVEGGAPADIFFSADGEWMDWLEERALVQLESRQDIVGNSLVFVVTDDSNLPNTPLGSAVLKGEGRLAIADPDGVPAGRYAKAALQAAGMWGAVSDQVVPAENVRAALALVERQQAELGVVYASDAHASAKVASAPLALPQGIAITYPAALLSTSNHPDAEALLIYLASDQAAAIMCVHGFIMPAGRAPC